MHACTLHGGVAREECVVDASREGWCGGGTRGGTTTESPQARSGRRLSSHARRGGAIGRSLADTHACVLCWLVNARHVVRMRSWKLAAIAKAKLQLWYWGLGLALAAAGAYAHGSCAQEREREEERLVLRARGLCLVLRCVTTTLVLGLLAKVRSPCARILLLPMEKKYI